MRVKIYQINPERDSNRMKFMSLSDSQSPDPSIYDEVFDAEIDENELEEIYGRFNTVGHPLFRGHSLSVSDVVVADGKATGAFWDGTLHAPAKPLCLKVRHICGDETVVVF